MKKRYTWLSVKKSSAAADMFDTEQIEVPMALTSIRACGGLYKGAQGRPHLDFKMDFKSPATHRRRRTSNEMMIQSNLQSNVVCLATRISITSTYQTLLHPLVCKLNYCKSPTVNLYFARLQRIPQRNLIRSSDQNNSSLLWIHLRGHTPADIPLCWKMSHGTLRVTERPVGIENGLTRIVFITSSGVFLIQHLH